MHVRHDAHNTHPDGWSAIADKANFSGVDADMASSPAL